MEKLYQKKLGYLGCLSGLNLLRQLHPDIQSQLMNDVNQILTNIRVNKNDIFGVFVSIERSNFYKLSTYPFDIHGCIGYWNKSFQSVSIQNIVDQLVDVAYKATWMDNRNGYFSDKIWKDSNAIYKIYIMNLPIYEIHPVTGIITELGIKFTNNEYGIIVYSETGESATYLPGVFPDKSWIYIKNSIGTKAGINNNTNTSTSKIKYFGYRCTVAKVSIQDCFKTYLYTSIKRSLTDWINNYFGIETNSFIPYEITNNKINVDKTQDVRNIATIYDFVTHLFEYKLSNNALYSMYKILKYYKRKYKSSENYQAISFLLLAFQTFNKKTKFNNQHINKYIAEKYAILCMNENIQNYEPDFELCEVGIALNKLVKYSDHINYVDHTGDINTIEAILDRILMDKRNIAYEKENNNSLNKYVNWDDVFRYNWNCKYLESIYWSWRYNGKSRESIRHNIGIKIRKIRDMIIKKMIIFCDNNLEELETNYLAVILECLNSIRKIGELTGELSDDIMEKINNNIIYVMYLLVKTRLNNDKKINKYGLFKFKNGSIRLDITGHILNGIAS